MDSIVSMEEHLRIQRALHLTSSSYDSLVVPSKDNITAFLFGIIRRYLIGVGESLPWDIRPFLYFLICFICRRLSSGAL